MLGIRNSLAIVSMLEYKALRGIVRGIRRSERVRENQQESRPTIVPANERVPVCRPQLPVDKSEAVAVKTIIESFWTTDSHSWQFSIAMFMYPSRHAKIPL
jgi:hypothetical protein